MSRELRTPLNSILGLSKAMRDEIYGAVKPKQREVLGTIQRNGKHLRSLINDLLDIAQIEAGKTQVNRQRLYLPSIVESSLQIVEEMAHKKRLIFLTPPTRRHKV